MDAKSDPIVFHTQLMWTVAPSFARIVCSELFPLRAASPATQAPAQVAPSLPRRSVRLQLRASPQSVNTVVPSNLTTSSPTFSSSPASVSQLWAAPTPCTRRSDYKMNVSPNGKGLLPPLRRPHLSSSTTKQTSRSPTRLIMNPPMSPWTSQTTAFPLSTSTGLASALAFPPSSPSSSLWPSSPVPVTSQAHRGLTHHRPRRHESHQLQSAATIGGLSGTFSVRSARPRSAITRILFRCRRQVSRFYTSRRCGSGETTN